LTHSFTGQAVSSCQAAMTSGSSVLLGSEHALPFRVHVAWMNGGSARPQMQGRRANDNGREHHKHPREATYSGRRA
jgi:hypothetical protein